MEEFVTDNYVIIIERYRARPQKLTSMLEKVSADALKIALLDSSSVQKLAFMIVLQLCKIARV